MALPVIIGTIISSAVNALVKVFEASSAGDDKRAWTIAKRFKAATDAALEDDVDSALAKLHKRFKDD